MLVGLTGGIGSGKSLVAKYFEELGIDVIDTDIVAREVVAPGSKSLTHIVAKFGENILLANGSLNRQKLRDIIFNSSSAKTWLENLLHPEIRQQSMLKASQSKSKYCLLAITLLKDKKSYNLSKLITVVSDYNTKINRIIKRDDCSKEQAIAIINSQKNQEHMLNIADYVISNDKDRSYLKNQVKNIHLDLLSNIDLNKP